MRSPDEPAGQPVKEADLAEVASLIRDELHDDTISGAYLKWWYRDNPFGLSSLYAIKRENRIRGVASIVGLQFKVSGRPRWIGLPEKVLVAASLRGKGLFGPLYWKTEQECLNHGCDGFLNLFPPKGPSAPIFLKRFHYVMGLNPDLLVLPFSPVSWFEKASFRVVSDISRDFFLGGVYSFNNAVAKDYDYLRWRYLSFERDRYEILEVLDGKSTVLGYVVLRRVRKVGIPIILLMDLVVRSLDDAAPALRQARLYSSRRAAACLLLFENDELERVFNSIAHFRVKNRFSLLVKGRSAEDTALLSKTSFNFFFGDLDFI